MILGDKKRKVEHLVEEADPAICTSAVKCHFFWGVEATKLIWSRDDLNVIGF